jgi:hypothetical protein
MPTKTRFPLDLARKLAHPIVLTAGPQSRLETLQDAAILIRVQVIVACRAAMLESFQSNRTRRTCSQRAILR